MIQEEIILNVGYLYNSCNSIKTQNNVDIYKKYEVPIEIPSNIKTFITIMNIILMMTLSLFIIKEKQNRKIQYCQNICQR